MSLLLLKQLGAEEGLRVDQLRQAADQLVVQLARTGKMARFQHRGQDGDVLRGFVATFLDRPHAVAQVQAHVPQVADQVFDRLPLFVLRRGGGENQDVDVGVGEQLAASVAADGHQAGKARYAGVAGNLREQAVDAARQAAQQRLDPATGAKLVDQQVAGRAKLVAQGKADVVHDAGRKRVRPALRPRQRHAIRLRLPPAAAFRRRS